MKLYTILILGFLACHKVPSKKEIVEPKKALNCLDQKITDFKSRACEKASVKEFLFQNKEVYVFDVGRCGADFTSDVFDKDCKKIGSLGGFMGNTLINNQDFKSAKFQKVIWEKPNEK